MDDGFGEFHHLAQDKEIIEAERDLIRNEVDKVGEELVEAWVGADGLQGGHAQSGLFFIGVIVEDGGLDLVEVEDKLFADDVLNGWSEGDIVIAGEGSQGRVGAWALW